MGYLHTDLIEYKSGNVIKGAAAPKPEAGSFCSWSSFITCIAFFGNHLFSWNNTGESAGWRCTLHRKGILEQVQTSLGLYLLPSSLPLRKNIANQLCVKQWIHLWANKMDLAFLFLSLFPLLHPSSLPLSVSSFLPFFSLSCFLSIPAQPATFGLGSSGSICLTPGPHHGMAWCCNVCAQREAMSPTAAHRLGSLHPGLGGFQLRGELEESGLPPLLFGLSAFRMSPSSSQKPSGMARGSGWAFCC